MRLWAGFSIFAVIGFALSSDADASSSSATVGSDDNTTYLAPLLQSCNASNPHCEIMEGRYLVTIHEDYKSTAHLAYVTKNINVNPVKDWRIKRIGDGVYSINDVSSESIDIIRQDPGVIEVEEDYRIVKVEVDGCSNSRLSVEERRICYEEKDMPDCERPSLSKRERQSCYGMMKFMSCIDEKFDKGIMHPCKKAIGGDPCENPKLSKEETRFCRDGSLFATCNNPLISLFKEGRRTCAKNSITGNSVHGKSDKLKNTAFEASEPIVLRSDDDLAPLNLATSDYGRPNTYIVTLFRGCSYHDHFRIIGRDLKADKLTSFKWFKIANSYFATKITSEWIQQWNLLMKTSL
ncbi:hypothetical protein E4T44_05159 [Aureobasidium sp. EXF-8845]|nr:hypothetical protein E4T44_05159 [Aureobasidium sp. EXF-8845]